MFEYFEYGKRVVVVRFERFIECIWELVWFFVWLDIWVEEKLGERIEGLRVGVMLDGGFWVVG